MKERISELMDGELASEDANRALAALRSDREAREAWRTYHLISDSLRETRILSRGFTERFAARLAEEPTVLAPAAATWALWLRQRLVARRAAGVVALLVVLGVTVTAVWNPGESPKVAQVPEPPPVAAAEPAPKKKEAAKDAATDPLRVALPEGARDYLLAHQGYAPRYALQGYARTVSDMAGNRR